MPRLFFFTLHYHVVFPFCQSVTIWSLFSLWGKMGELNRMIMECGKQYETKTVIGNLKAAPIFTL